MYESVRCLTEGWTGDARSLWVDAGEDAGRDARRELDRRHERQPGEQRPGRREELDAVAEKELYRERDPTNVRQ